MLIGISTVMGNRGRSSTLIDDRQELCFLQQVLHAMSLIDKELKLILFTDSSSHAEFPDYERIRITRSLSFFSGDGAAVASAARNTGVDAVLAPLSCPLPPSFKKPQILFALDLAFMGILEKRLPGKSLKTPRAVQRVLKSCAALICTSQALQKTCASQLGLGLERIPVISPGAENLSTENTAPIAQPPYAVFVANRYTLPCLPALREAMQKRPELFPPTLVVVGPPFRNEPEDWGVGSIRIERCPGQIFATLLHHAEIFLYPAIEDGCGMTVVEALRVGVPILTARNGAPAEWGGNVPIYCEPQNPTSIIQALRRLHDETAAERQDRLSMGHAMSTEYTWDRCAWKILSTLKHG